MFCQNCGNQLNEGAAFCPNCGAQTGMASEIRVQGTNNSNVNSIKIKTIILICIGIIFYIFGLGFMGSMSYFCSYDIDSSFMAVSILAAVCFLIVLGELICAIANKKAVFVLSVVQAIVCVLNINLFLLLMSSFGEIIHISMGAMWVFSVFFIEIPIMACALLLLGAMMYRTKNIINEVSGAER